MPKSKDKDAKAKTKEPWRYQLRDQGHAGVGGGPRADIVVEGQGVDNNDLIVLLTDSGEQRRAPNSLTPSGVSYAPNTKPPESGPRYSGGSGEARLVAVSNIQAGRVGLPCTFNVDAVRAGTGGLEIVVSVNGHTIPNYVKTLTRGLYEVNFTPQSPDPHVVEITFNGAQVPGSPFAVPVQYEVSTPMPSVTDVGSIIISAIRGNIVGKPATFEVDASRAGRGALSVEVFGVRSHPIVRLTPAAMRGIYEASFVPEEGGVHNIDASFNGLRIPGCPLKHAVINPREVAVRWDGLQACSVQNPVTFSINTQSVSSDDCPLEVIVTDCTSQRIPVQLNRAGNFGMTANFTPVRVGKMAISVLACGEHVIGSPFASFAYDASAVRIENVTQPGVVGREMSFTVDLTAAGKGSVDVYVTCMGMMVQSFCQFIDDNHQRYSFIPIRPMDHFVTVTFNKQPVMTSALVLKVIDVSGGMTGFAMNSVAPQQMMYPTIYPSQSMSFDPNLVVASVTAPNGAKLPARVLQQPNGDYKVDYNSPFTGSHRVDIMYNNQPLKGSPFVVDIYDPSKIRVNGPNGGVVNQAVHFDVIQTEAGPAKLEVSVRGPSGRNVPVNLSPIPSGTHVSYVPYEAGPHIVMMTYGGLEVAGMPLTHMITGDGASQQTSLPPPLTIIAPTPISYDGPATHTTSDVTVSGEGLKRAAVNHITKFTFSRVGQPQGRLHVHVDAPNSVLACQMEPDPSTEGLYSIAYTPLEIGVHKIVVRWNGMDLEGSPYIVKVVDPLQVKPVGGWESVLDSSGVLQMLVNELMEIPFSTRDAGEGELSAVVTDPYGSKVNVMVMRAPDSKSQIVKFTPRVEGEYQLMVSWGGFDLIQDPVKCVAAPKVMSDKVKVSGLTMEADYFAGEQCVFEVDAANGGKGELKVKVHGIQADAEAEITEIGTNRYRCSFVPPMGGLYLITIIWGDKQVPGSPFKINVQTRGDPSKVTFRVKDNAQAVVDIDRMWIIDKRSAGVGQLAVTCTGPMGPVRCDLQNAADGTQILTIHPELVGTYTLVILFDGQHVPGSPHVFDVQPVGDPNKVTVSGPGIQDGVLAIYDSDFVVDTTDAGLGQLTVRIRGPKGAFRVELKRDSPADRTIKCHYDPTEVGLYTVDVQWSGVSVPGSPFPVNIFDTLQELEKYHRRYPERRPKFRNAPAQSNAFRVFED